MLSASDPYYVAKEEVAKAMDRLRGRFDVHRARRQRMTWWLMVARKCHIFAVFIHDIMITVTIF